MNFNIVVPSKDIMNICSMILRGENDKAGTLDNIASYLKYQSQYIEKLTAFLSIIEAKEAKDSLEELSGVKGLVDAATAHISSYVIPAAETSEEIANATLVESAAVHG